MIRFSHYSRRQLIKGFLVGGLIGLFGILLASTDSGRWLEEDLGLGWLFKFRGERAAPQEVVVISMDSRSSQRLGLPNKPRLWPRSLHGQLVNKLAASGVSSISFDVIFDEIRDQRDNRMFADAMHQAGNVLLYQSVKSSPIYSEDSDRRRQVIGITEQLIPPIPSLRDSALGLSLFPLPKVPIRINHFNLFHPQFGNLATLPVLAQFVHSLDEYEIIARLLKTDFPVSNKQLPISRHDFLAARDVHTVVSSLRSQILENPVLKAHLTTFANGQNGAGKLQALIHTLTMPNSAYLNFYGPPGSIRTIPYFRVLEAGPGELDLKGRAVFVGFAEEFQPEQADVFYTVFTNPQSGLDISGVEIAATAFANLLENSVINAAGAITDISILMLWAVFLGLVLRLLPGQLVFPAATACALAYSSLVYWQFSHYDYWLPLGIPLLIQTPLIVLSTLVWQYVDAQRERRNIRQAFGLHLPADVVDQLASGIEHITETGQHVNGVVMSTDAERYTSLSENMPASELRELMNLYYATLFSPIRKADGIVSDVVGDAVLAIWPSYKPDANKRYQACLAALKIVQAVDRLNKEAAQHALPTRLGLHYGEIVLGHIGAEDHYEYRAVGDIVNTASRIEGLNKLLGTRIIVSEDVLEGLKGFITRELGKFILVGKQQAQTLFELIGTTEEADTAIDYTIYNKAIHAFKYDDPDTAQQYFTDFISRYGADGPSEYYLTLIQSGETCGPDGAIKLSQK